MRFPGLLSQQLRVEFAFLLKAVDCKSLKSLLRDARGNGGYVGVNLCYPLPSKGADAWWGKMTNLIFRRVPAGDGPLGHRSHVSDLNRVPVLNESVHRFVGIRPASTEQHQHPEEKDGDREGNPES